jgi:hypothetical protein
MTTDISPDGGPDRPTEPAGDRPTGRLSAAQRLAVALGTSEVAPDAAAVDAED